MKKLEIKNDVSSFVCFENYQDTEIELMGQIQNFRLLAWGGFLILRTSNYLIQAVVDGSIDNGCSMDALRPETTIKIKGKFAKAQIKDKSINPHNFELKVQKIEIISSPHEAELPVDTTKKELNIDLHRKLDYRPLTLRHPKQKAIFKISALIFNEFGNFLSTNGFTRICSPKIVFSGAEGGANIFKINYFDRSAFLAQSPQFYKQMMVGVFGRVFEEAPVFRAEAHDTSRHVNEYISLDVEMIIEQSFTELMQLETSLLKTIFEKVKSECAYELELLEAEVPDISAPVVINFAEVKKIIRDVYKKPEHFLEKDLAPEEERDICDYARKNFGTDFVFVTKYPIGTRPFYAKGDDQNPEESLSFDLLFRGLEITTGGQRLNKYSEYEEKMTRLGLNIESFASYLQAFKYGMPPHGGFGLGLERLVAQICKLSNVKEASLFPRDINRLEP